MSLSVSRWCVRFSSILIVAGFTATGVFATSFSQDGGGDQDSDQDPTPCEAEKTAGRAEVCAFWDAGQNGTNPTAKQMIKDYGPGTAWFLEAVREAEQDNDPSALNALWDEWVDLPAEYGSGAGTECKKAGRREKAKELHGRGS